MDFFIISKIGYLDKADLRVIACPATWAPRLGRPLRNDGLGRFDRSIGACSGFWNDAVLGVQTLVEQSF